MLKRLKDIKNGIRSVENPSPRLRRLLRNINILIVQLTNGLRRSEAIKCYYQFLKTLEREQMVKIGKSKNRYRPCLIPPAIDMKDVKLTRDLPEPHPATLTMTALRRLGINTHSLRYAFINKALRKGTDLATLSKIVGHVKLDTLITYVQEKRARETLEEFIKEVK